MKTRTYTILEEAIENGIEQGWRRAHKHTDEPDEQALKYEIHNAIMLQIHRYFEFEQTQD